MLPFYHLHSNHGIDSRENQFSFKVIKHLVFLPKSQMIGEKVTLHHESKITKIQRIINSDNKLETDSDLNCINYCPNSNYS